jgi:hypothetical protein
LCYYTKYRVVKKVNKMFGMSLMPGAICRHKLSEGSGMKRSKSNLSFKKYGSRGLQPLARAVMVVTAVAVLATGVTYAALQSPAATLSGNSISTATADLKISTTTATSSTSFAATKTGFNFTNIVPGATPAPSDGNLFYLKNFGAVPMALKVSIGTTPVNASNVDLSKVYIVLTRLDGTTTSQKLSVASLIASQTSGGLALTDNLAGVTAAQYKTQIVMDDDAFTGSSATISGIDLVFTGTVVAQ